MKKARYYNNVNADLLAGIPRSSKVVIEFGCGNGALGAAYKLSNPLVYYTGVEFNPQAADLAAKVLDHVVCGNIEDPTLILSEKKDILYDCLVYGNVLEHLKNPWNCLSRHLNLLAEDGVVVACIPNVQHWSVMANLMMGQWPYVDQGLFDRTHLRWFTRDSICEWFESVGLHIYDLKPRIFDADKAKEFVQKMLPALKNFGVNPQKVFEGVAPLQYLIVAGTIQRKKILVEGFSSIRPEVMAEVRLSQPLRIIDSQACVQSKMHFKKLQLTPVASGSQRVLIWQRPIFHVTEQDLESIRKLINYGYTIVTDWDDDPSHWPEFQDDNYMSFKIVHAVQTSKHQLAHILSQWNPNVMVFPNMIEKLPEPYFERNRKSIYGLRMFFGALNREKDWAPLIDDLNAVFRRDPQFWTASVVHDRAFFDAIHLPSASKSFMPLCSHEDYLKEMSSCDFAFLPLFNTPFNTYCLVVLFFKIIFNNIIVKMF